MSSHDHCTGMTVKWHEQHEVQHVSRLWGQSTACGRVHECDHAYAAQTWEVVLKVYLAASQLSSHDVCMLSDSSRIRAHLSYGWQQMRSAYLQHDVSHHSICMLCELEAIANEQWNQMHYTWCTLKHVSCQSCQLVYAHVQWRCATVVP